MKSLLIAILVLVPLYAFAQDAKMPTEAKKVIDKYEASVEVARKAFDSVVAKARDQALKDLKPIQVSETKKGNLDGAMLVKGKVDELTAEIPKPASEGDLAKPLPPSTDPRVSLLLGRWKLSSPGSDYVSTWEFKEDGIVERPHENKQGKYVIEKDKVIVTWPPKGIETLRLPKPGSAVMEGTTSSGVKIILEKADK